jgi:hypothetical protein
MNLFPLTGRLGLTASGPRTIKSGKQYEKYFDTSKLMHTDKVVLEGTTYDTLDKMASIVHETLDDTKAISEVLQGASVQQTARNIWQFLYDHIDYVQDDTNFEELRRPLRTWHDRKGDCDCYSIFISSVLTNLGIDHAFRMAGYKDDFQHVYVIIPTGAGSDDYIVVDPVLNAFNQEEPYSKKYDKHMKMPIKYLNGVDDDILFAQPQASTPQVHYPYGYEFVSLGKNGLGMTQDPALLASDFLARVRSHLINTYNELERSGADPLFQQEIDQVLQVWENPVQRDVYIDQFVGAMHGLGIDLSQTLSDAQFTINNLLQEQKPTFWQKVKGAISNVGQAIGEGWSHVKNIASSQGQQIISSNPYYPGTAYQNQPYTHPQPSQNNMATWLTLGAVGLATVLLVSSSSKPTQSTKNTQKAGAKKPLAGTRRKSSTRTTTRKPAKKTLSKLVMG